jgi:phage major head subunit gpT-like protein
MSEASNVWKLTTFGRIVSLSRQALVNDDLSAFSGLLAEFGRSAARREADELVKLITGTPQIDGADLFHEDRSSLISTPLTSTGLQMRSNHYACRKRWAAGSSFKSPRFLLSRQH